MSDKSLDNLRRRFLKRALAVCSGVGAYCAARPFVSALSPNRDTQARAMPVIVDVSGLAPGDLMAIAWRGQPVWVLRRTSAMQVELDQHRAQLRDPDSQVAQQPAYAKNADRALRKDISVLIGICTHLGCTPAFRPQLAIHSDKPSSGFYCPCHGSVFDVAGRVFRGAPAPINLAVPPHRYIDRNTLEVGRDQV